MTGRKHKAESLIKMSENSKGEKNPMYGTKRPKWIVDKMQSNRWENVTKKEKILMKINRKLRQELIITKDLLNIRCVSHTHAAKEIGVSHQSIQKAIKSGRHTCKGWTIQICDDILYNEDLVLNHLDLFDSDCFPQPELVEMLKAL